MSDKQISKLLDRLSEASEHHFETENVCIGFEQYLELIRRNPALVQNAFSRMYAMLQSFGTRTIRLGESELLRYNLFDDPFDRGLNAVYGIDLNLEELIAFFQSAADNSSLSHRILILHGPKGSAKSTIVNLFKRGLEEYSKTAKGSFYTLDWSEKDKFLGFAEGSNTLNQKYNVTVCPINEEPLHLLNRLLRDVPDGVDLEPHYEKWLGQKLQGDLCPFCNEHYNLLREQHKGNLRKVLEEVRVKKTSISRANRVGIGVIDNLMEEDIQGLVGYAVDTLPDGARPAHLRRKEFFLDGEMNVANRGLLEVKEIFRGVSKYGLSQKLKRLMSASQEHIVKPGNCPEMEVDEVLIGHTNPLQYDMLLSLEDDAFNSRLITYDIPHLLIANEEAKIYQKEFNHTVYPKVHFSPHLFRCIAGFAVMSRLTDDIVEKDSATTAIAGLKGRRHSLEIRKEYESQRYDADLIYDKYRCYNGDTLKVGGRQLDVRATMIVATKNGEGLGIGFDPRYFQNLLSFVLMNDICTVHTERCSHDKCIDPLLAMDAIRANINEDKGQTAEKLDNYLSFLEKLTKEYYGFLIEDVEQAMGLGDLEKNQVLERYLRELTRAIKKESSRDRFSQKDLPANGEFLDKIESYLEDKPEDYRSRLLSLIVDIRDKQGQVQEADSMSWLVARLKVKKPELLTAVKRYLEDYQGDFVIKLRKAMRSLAEVGKVAPEDLDTFEDFRNRLIEHQGYCGHCADKIVALYAREVLPKTN